MKTKVLTTTAALLIAVIASPLAYIDLGWPGAAATLLTYGVVWGLGVWFGREGKGE